MLAIGDAGDREVADSALGVNAPVDVRRHLHLADAVMFQTGFVRCFAHASIFLCEGWKRQHERLIAPCEKPHAGVHSAETIQTHWVFGQAVYPGNPAGPFDGEMGDGAACVAVAGMPGAVESCALCTKMRFQ